MSEITKQEILDQIASMYQAKQNLAVLDNDLNTQAEAIMTKAREDVEALKAASEDARKSAQEIVNTLEVSLAQGK